MTNRSAIAFLFCLIFFVPAIFAASLQNEADPILDSADAFFKALNRKDYQSVWAGISGHSKKSIVKETSQAIQKATGEEISAERMENDFSSGGPISSAYWKGFLSSFDPVTVLEKSVWEMGEVKAERADIIIKYRKASQPVVLRMFKEGGSWKVGFVETFQTGR